MILSADLWKVRSLVRDIWVRVVLMLVLGVVVVLLAPILADVLPQPLTNRIEEKDVTDLLSILSGSMLAVATFSLSVMVTAHHYASNQVTPRSHRLLRQDTRTQSALATFIGAFVFALVGRIAMTTGLYDRNAFAVLYGAAVIVIALVIVALVRWVQHISALGSMEQTTDRVEAATRTAMERRMELPFLGARPAQEQVHPDALAIGAGCFGWVQHIDMPRLNDLAEEMGRQIHLEVLPGSRVVPDTVLLRVEPGAVSTQQQTELAQALTIGHRRSFDQDPAFGLEVLSEIAQRALSPGLNDPRTATDVIYRILSLLALWSGRKDQSDIRFPRLHAPSLKVETLVAGALDAIARDGADRVEVQLALQEALTTLSRSPDATMARTARALSARAIIRSDQMLGLEEDAQQVRARAPGVISYSAASR